MKRLLYVKHGETKMNVAGLLCGISEAPLTINGVEHANLVAAEILETHLPIDRIICSPSERTVMTAQIIAHKIGYPEDQITKDERFIERSYGVLEATSADEFLDHHGYKDFDDISGAETVEQLQARAARALAYLRTIEDDTVLVVGHSAFGRALRRVTQGLSYSHEYEVDSAMGNDFVAELVTPEA